MHKPDIIKSLKDYQVRLHQYDRYLPTAFDESLSLLEKVNKVILALYEYSEITREMLLKWNEVYEWIMGRGLEDAVNKKLNEWLTDGTLDKIINENLFNDLNEKIDGIIEDVKKITESLSKDFVDTFSGIINIGRLYGDLIGVQNDADVLQMALDVAKNRGSATIYIPKGVYTINKTLRIYKNTTIYMNEETVIKRGGENAKDMVVMFINGELKNSDYAVRYNGDGNIHMYGGTIDGGYLELGSKPGDYSTAGFVMVHAENLSFNNVKFKNFVDNHVFEMNSSKNVRFNDCIFKDIIKTESYLIEVIQIDFADRTSVPSIGAWDDTVCDDVLISGCVFENTPTGVGTHSSKLISGKLNNHTNIKVVNNTFKNITDPAIRSESWDGFVVTGNTIETTNKDAVYVLSSSNGVVSDNAIVNAGNHGMAITNKSVSGSSMVAENIIVSNNTIQNCGAMGIRLNTTADVHVTGNSISEITETAISCVNSKDVSFTNNRIRDINLGDFYSYGINIGDSEGCFVSGNTIKNGVKGFMYRFAIGVSPGIVDIVVSNNNIETGTVGDIRRRDNVTSLSPISKEVYLTGAMSSSVGDIIDLNDDITKYTELVVCCGVSGNNTDSHSIARGWHREKFKVGETINVLTQNGKTSLKIVSSKQIQVTHADNSFRYMIGVR